jgi:hypothetical protein
VREAHGGFGLVDLLAAGTRRAEEIDAQILGLDLDFADFLDFGQHGHGGGRRVDAPLRFGFRHALHAMAAAFVAQGLVDVRAFDGKNDFLEAAEIGRRRVDDARLPTARVGELGIHAEQVAGEQRGFLPAGAGADFQDGVAAVVGIRRQHQRHERAFGGGERGFQLRLLRARDFGQFRIARAVGEQFGVAGELLSQAPQILGRPRQVAQALMFAPISLNVRGFDAAPGTDMACSSSSARAATCLK